MISVLARLGSPEIVGQYALGLAISAPILMLTPVRRQVAATTDIRVMALVFALLGIAAIGFLEHSTQDRLAILIVSMAQSVEWIAEVYSGRRGTLSLFLHGSLSVLTLAFFVAVTGRTGAGLLSVLIVRLLVLFFYDFRYVAQVPALSGDTKSAYASFAATVPCYFVAHMLGYHSLGIFAATASLARVGNVLVDVLAKSLAPRMKRSYDEGDQETFARLTIRLVGGGLVLALSALWGSLIAGQWVLGRLFGSEYARHPDLLVILAAVSGLGFVASLLGCALDAGRRFYEQASLAMTAITVTSLACVALVPRIGMIGAALAAGLGAAVQTAGQMWLARSILRHPRRVVLLALLKEPVA
jgi:hypothetical protein